MSFVGGDCAACAPCLGDDGPEYCCAARHEETGFLCTRERGHAGSHVACHAGGEEDDPEDLPEHELAVWG